MVQYNYSIYIQCNNSAIIGNEAISLDTTIGHKKSKYIKIWINYKN